MRGALMWLFVVGCTDAAVKPPPPAPPQAVPLGNGYTVPLTIGGQTFAMTIDSGSTTVAVASNTCTTCAGVSPIYTPGAGAVDQHRIANTEYADMSMWSGEIYSDSVGLAVTPSVPLDFVSITTQKTFFMGDNKFQGILGLGPLDVANPGTSSFVGQEMQAGVDPVLAFQFCNDHGRLWVGGYDPAFAATAPTYTQMLPMDMTNPFYTVAVDDIGIGGTSLGFDASAIGPSLIDTGAGAFVVSQPINDALTAAIESSPGFLAAFGSQHFADGCLGTVTPMTAAELDAALPPLTLAFPSMNGGTFTMTLPASQSYLQPYEGRYCLVVESLSDFDETILGNTIMRAFITVVDLANAQVGFAPEVGCSTAS